MDARASSARLSLPGGAPAGAPRAEGAAEAPSFDGLLRQLAEAHRSETEGYRSEIEGYRSEIEGYKSELGALRDKHAKLTEKLRERGDAAAECCPPGGGRLRSAAGASVDALPGAVAPPHEDAGDGQDLPTLRLSEVSDASRVVSDEARPGSLSSREQVAFPLRTSWSQSIEFPHKVSNLSNFKKMATLNFQPAQSDGAGDFAWSWYVAEPNSQPRLAWEMAGALFILYDLFALPMAGFDVPRTAFSICMDWVTLIFWTLNVVASMTVGYSEEGLLVMDPAKIRLKYLKTWFVLDLAVVVPDWIFTIAEVTSGGGDTGGEGETVKLLRVLRLVRMVRLLRLVKLRKMFAKFHDLITSEYTSVVLNIVQMILALLVINHLICCVWYTLSKGMLGKNMTWIEESGFEGDGWGYLYWTSFHWSITQFTPASMAVQPQNLTERVFAVGVVIFALIGFSYIVGSISQSLAQLRSMNAEESRLFWDLRQYLVKNKVPQQLSIRVQKYLEHRWQATRESKSSKDVHLIQLLSEQLTGEMKYELALHHLKVHPFFKELCTISSVTVFRIANSALARKLLAEGDTLFHPGEAATHMYVVVAGSYLYNRVDVLGVPHCEQVHKGEDWIAEPALWTESWSHCGLLTAVDHSENVTVDSVVFSEQVRLNPQAYVFTSHYAKSFMRWLNGLPPDQLSDISQGENVSDLCRSFMPKQLGDGEAEQGVAARKDSQVKRGPLRGALSSSHGKR